MGKERQGAVDPRVFGSLAQVYHRARPGYPEALLDYLLPRVRIASGDAVADIGAGTGRLTEMLARRGLAVTAVEPLAAMRNQAHCIEGVRWSHGTFERTGLESQSQKWVVSAQAFHWADTKIALPEMHRILEPQGWLTVLWNTIDVRRESILVDAFGILKKHAPAYRVSNRTQAWRRLSSKIYGKLLDPIQGLVSRGTSLIGVPDRISRGVLLRSTGDFHRVRYHEIRHHRQVDRDTFLDLWRSQAYLRSVVGAHGLDDFIRGLTDELERREISIVRIPYICVGWSAQAR